MKCISEGTKTKEEVRRRSLLEPEPPPKRCVLSAAGARGLSARDGAGAYAVLLALARVPTAAQVYKAVRARANMLVGTVGRYLSVLGEGG